MAITTTLDYKLWKMIDQLVLEVLLERKSHFQIETILEVMKQKFITNDIDPQIMDYSYFQLLLLNRLDSLVEQGTLYPIDDYYFPVLYMEFQDYDTNYSELLYFTLDSSQQPLYINVDNLEETRNRTIRDFLLTGGSMTQKILLPPEIPFEEIYSLYQSFLQEGVPKNRAINHILNYYQVQSLPWENKFPNTLKIQSKTKKNQNVKILKPDSSQL